MNTSQIWLLAQRHNWERLGDQFSGENAQIDYSDFGWLAIGAVVAVLALWWLSALAKQMEGTSTRSNPASLFRELCRAHGLTSAERSLLKRLAEVVGVKHPAMLFVRSDAFDVKHVPDEAAAIRELKQKLFAT